MYEFQYQVTSPQKRTTSHKLYQLTYSSPLASLNSVLNVLQNKKQVIEVIIRSLADEIDISGDVGLKLIVTGQNHIPIQISPGLVISRQDLQNFHKEADEIVVAQAIYAATVEAKHVQVVAVDTSCFCFIIT